MKQLRFTTTPPCGMFSIAYGEALVMPDDKGETIQTETKYNRAYIHGDAEDLAGFDIPFLIDGDIGQLDLDIAEQDILMLLPSGEYPCVSTKDTNYEYYLLTLK
jgi:hypothetical protein